MADPPIPPPPPSAPTKTDAAKARSQRRQRGRKQGKAGVVRTIRGAQGRHLPPRQPDAPTQKQINNSRSKYKATVQDATRSLGGSRAVVSTFRADEHQASAHARAEQDACEVDRELAWHLIQGQALTLGEKADVILQLSEHYDGEVISFVKMAERDLASDELALSMALCKDITNLNQSRSEMEDSAVADRLLAIWDDIQLVIQSMRHPQQPNTEVTPSAQRRTASSKSRQPNTDATASAQPMIASSESRQPNTNATSPAQRRTASSKSRQPNTDATASAQPMIASSESRQPNTNATSPAQPRTASSASRQPNTNATPPAQRRTPSSKLRQLHTCTTSPAQEEALSSTSGPPRTRATLLAQGGALDSATRQLHTCTTSLAQEEAFSSASGPPRTGATLLAQGEALNSATRQQQQSMAPTTQREVASSVQRLLPTSAGLGGKGRKRKRDTELSYPRAEPSRNLPGEAVQPGQQVQIDSISSGTPPRDLPQSRPASTYTERVYTINTNHDPGQEWRHNNPSASNNHARDRRGSAAGSSHLQDKSRNSSLDPSHNSASTQPVQVDSFLGCGKGPSHSSRDFQSILPQQAHLQDVEDISEYGNTAPSTSELAGVTNKSLKSDARYRQILSNTRVTTPQQLEFSFAARSPQIRRGSRTVQHSERPEPSRGLLLSQAQADRAKADRYEAGYGTAQHGERLEPYRGLPFSQAKAGSRMIPLQRPQMDHLQPGAVPRILPSDRPSNFQGGAAMRHYKHEDVSAKIQYTPLIQEFTGRQHRRTEGFSASNRPPTQYQEPNISAQRLTLPPPVRKTTTLPIGSRAGLLQNVRLGRREGIMLELGSKPVPAGRHNATQARYGQVFNGILAPPVGGAQRRQRHHPGGSASDSAPQIAAPAVNPTRVAQTFRDDGLFHADKHRQQREDVDSDQETDRLIAECNKSFQ